MTATTTAPATASQLKKAAKKEFTRRGQMLTRIEQELARLGNGGSWFLGLQTGPVFEVQTIMGQANGWRTDRGYITQVEKRGLSIQDMREDDMEYFFALGQLTTDSLERLAGVLATATAKKAS